jgi:DNA-binding XRE family transcriptional regulator
MSAVDWTQFEEPWRGCGQQFVDQLAGRPPRPSSEITPAGLRQRRIARGLTRVELARIAGLPVSSVDDAERGSSRPALRRLARVLDHLPR